MKLMDTFCLQEDIQKIAASLVDVADKLSGKHIVITGGMGFLCRYFTKVIEYLNAGSLDKKCHVTCIDNYITAGDFGKNYNSSNLNFMEKDVSQPISFSEKVDYIIHAAGIASPYYYRMYPPETLDVAVVRTRNMLEVAREHSSRLLFMSSSEIYGDPDKKYIPTPESYNGNVSSLGARACYDESKRLGETLCQIYNPKYNTHTNIVRPFNVFGPGMQEKDYRVLPNFASRIKARQPLKIYGNGSQTRTFCYISDAVNGFLRALILGQPGEPYNIGNATPELSMVELAEKIKKSISQDISVDIVEYPDSYPADEPQRRCPDLTKSKIQLGYEPEISIDEGLSRFFRWAMDVYDGKG